jgi:hypothetical protein
VLLVVGNERLYVEMSKLMATNKTVSVVRVPKSDGVGPLLRLLLNPTQTHSVGTGRRRSVPIARKRCANPILLLRWTLRHFRSPLPLLHHRQIRRPQDLPRRRSSWRTGTFLRSPDRTVEDSGGYGVVTY